jgi:two-component system, cell cycle sensor histidine kinase PleC
MIRNGETERNLRSAEAAATAASKMKNGLFRVLSHELKTPLVALVGLTDVLSLALKDKVEAIEAEQLDHIVSASQRLNGMISDILVLSKSFSGPQSLRITHEPVPDLLEDSVIGVESRAREKGVKISITRPSKGLVINCDCQLLRQAIKKLVENAVKFSPDGGTVEIWVYRKPDRSTVISVRDNGPGIAPEKLQECLQPFIQEDMTYGRKAEGLGLGLPIVKSIAEAHGGNLIMQSQPGRGLVAGIWIPEIPLPN